MTVLFQDELRLLMQSLGFSPTDAMIQRMVIANDTNGDELIDFEEFVQMAEMFKEEEANAPHKLLIDAFK